MQPWVADLDSLLTAKRSLGTWYTCGTSRARTAYLTAERKRFNQCGGITTIPWWPASEVKQRTRPSSFCIFLCFNLRIVFSLLINYTASFKRVMPYRSISQLQSPTDVRTKASTSISTVRPSLDSPTPVHAATPSIGSETSDTIAPLVDRRTTPEVRNLFLVDKVLKKGTN